jgi:hypothetical protein
MTLREVLTAWRANMLGIVHQIVLLEKPVPDDQRSHRERLITQLLDLQARDREADVLCQHRMRELGEALREVETQAATLRAELNGEYGRQMVRSFELDTKTTKLQRALAACAPSQVEGFIERTTVEIERLMRATSEANTIRRLTELRTCKAQAEQLRTAPISLADVLTRIKRLEHSCGVVAATT